MGQNNTIVLAQLYVIHYATLNLTNESLLSYHTTRILAGSKILLFHPPTPGDPKVLYASWSRLTLVQYQAGAGDMHKVWGPETYLEPGGGDMAPPPQLMSEPFPRDKVEMTRNMSCGEATSLQHNKNTWLNPNYNPPKTRQAKTKQHSSNRPKRQMSVSVLTVQFWLWCYLLDAPWPSK